MAAVSVVTTVSVDGKDLAELLKGLQEQLDTQKQLSEKLEARCVRIHFLQSLPAPLLRMVLDLVLSGRLFPFLPS